MRRGWQLCQSSNRPRQLREVLQRMFLRTNLFRRSVRFSWSQLFVSTGCLQRLVYESADRFQQLRQLRQQMHRQFHVSRRNVRLHRGLGMRHVVRQSPNGPQELRRLQQGLRVRSELHQWSVRLPGCRPWRYGGPMWRIVHQYQQRSQ